MSQVRLNNLKSEVPARTFRIKNAIPRSSSVNSGLENINNDTVPLKNPKNDTASPRADARSPRDDVRSPRNRKSVDSSMSSVLSLNLDDASPTADHVAEVLDMLPNGIKKIKPIEIPEDPLEEEIKRRDRSSDRSPERRSPERRSRSSSSDRSRSRSSERSNSSEGSVKMNRSNILSQRDTDKKLSERISPRTQKKTDRSNSSERLEHIESQKRQQPQRTTEAPIKSKYPQRKESPRSSYYEEGSQVKGQQVQGHQVPTLENIKNLSRHDYSSRASSMASSRIDDLRERIEEEKRRKSQLSHKNDRSSPQSIRSSRMSEALNLKEKLAEQRRELERLRQERKEEEERKNIALEALKQAMEEERAEIELQKLTMENDYEEKKFEVERMRDEVDERLRMEEEKKRIFAADIGFELRAKKLENEHKLTLPSNLEEKRIAYEAVKNIIKRKQTVKNMRSLAIIIFIVVELVLSKIVGINVDGFLDSQMEQLEEYDDIFEEIIDEYFNGSGPKMNPFHKIGLLMSLNLVLVLIGNLIVRIDSSGIVSTSVSAGRKHVGDIVKEMFIGIDKGNVELGFRDNALINSYRIGRNLIPDEPAKKPTQQRQGPVYTG